MDRLPLPYAAHPAFRVANETTPPSAVAAFNDAYRRLELHDRVGSAQQATSALRAVFADLAASDADERLFLAELAELAEHRLADDLSHFGAQRPRQQRVADDRVQALEREKYFFSTLRPETVAQLKELARVPLDGLRANARAGRVRREDLSINTGPLAMRIVHALDREFERSGIHDVVSTYAQRRMIVSGVALELSVSSSTWWRDQYGSPRPPRTLYAHTDEGIANPKAIAYLSDVGPEHGPMSLYPQCEERLELTPLQKLVGRVINSVGRAPRLRALYRLDDDPRLFISEAFRSHFGRLPSALRYNSHLGWDVVAGSALEAALVAAELTMLGPAGTIAVFDGARVIHRGGMVERGERVALQIVFAAKSRLAATTSRVLAAGRDAFARRDELRRQVGRTIQRFSPKPHERLLRQLAQLLPELTAVDVGASYYAHPAWQVFQRARRTHWLAVEPNSQNTNYLDQWPWPSRVERIPFGLSEHGGDQILHITAVDSGSSLFSPVINADMAHRDHDRDYYFPLVERTIATKSLDDIVPPGTTPVIVKLDTQGAELSILRGARRTFASERIIGIESEATLLANPVMVGSGKFWELCQFLEARGFELLQLKPIEGGPVRPSALPRRTYLNECDAVFALTRSQLLARPVEHQLAALGFYVSYHLYDEARTLFDAIPQIDRLCTERGASAEAIRKLLAS